MDRSQTPNSNHLKALEVRIEHASEMLVRNDNQQIKVRKVLRGEKITVLMFMAVTAASTVLWALTSSVFFLYLAIAFALAAEGVYRLFMGLVKVHRLLVANKCDIRRHLSKCEENLKQERGY